MIGTTSTTDTRCILNDVNGDRIANDDDSGEGGNCWLNLENLQPGPTCFESATIPGGVMVNTDWFQLDELSAFPGSSLIS